MNDNRDEIRRLQAEFERLKLELQYLRRELEAMGLRLPEMEGNPSRRPMSPEARKYLKQVLAARARASKPTVPGKGGVSSPRVASKLGRDYENLIRTKTPPEEDE